MGCRPPWPSTPRSSTSTSAPTRNPIPLLEVRALEAGYGDVRVLHGVAVSIDAAEIVALLGGNGAGKSTLVNAVAGLLPMLAVPILLEGHVLALAGARNTF